MGTQGSWAALSDETYKCFAHLYVGRDKCGAVLFSLGVAIRCSVWVWLSDVPFGCGRQVFSLGVTVR